MLHQILPNDPEPPKMNKEQSKPGRRCFAEALTGVLTAPPELVSKVKDENRPSKKETEYLPSRDILKGPSKM